MDANKKTFVNTFDYKVIYAFTIKDEAHNGLIKIGDAILSTDLTIDKLTPNSRELNQAALDRIKSYTNTAGIKPELLHTELAIKSKKKEDNTIELVVFRDHEVHRVLENSGIKKVIIEGTTGREWYPIDIETAKKAIEAVKNNYANLSNTPSDNFIPIILRSEQEDAVKKTIKQFKKGDRMLWNAKMRYGKTLTALEVVRRCGFKKTIIITHRPVVNDGWYDDFKNIFHGTGYCYGSKSKGYTVEDLEEKLKEKLSEKPNEKEVGYVYFASIQDLRGSETVGGKYSKNEAIFQTLWDCVIVDEAHEGTRTALGDDTIKAVVKEDQHKTKVLALSGTPFNIIDQYNEDEIYTWDYIMEQQCKFEWDKYHYGDSNPYDDLPELRIFTYDLGDLFLNSNYVTFEDKAFNFHEFFRTWTGDFKNDHAQMPESAKIGDFVHEEDINSFLNLMTKTDEVNNYPYSNERYRDLFRHSLWMVPGVKEAKALKELMLKHPVFGCGQFDIVNVAGSNDEESADALNSVRNAIADAEKFDLYTITLSCGKLTTGVTVKEWTAVFMLAGSYSTSAANYLQTIFRAQSPCTKNGKMKTTAYVFDFAPDRTLKMVSEAVSVSSKAGKTTDDDRTILGKFLNFCPVISISGSKMQQYSTEKLLQQLKRAYADKVVRNGFDDKNLYNDELLKLSDLDIKKFNNLKGIIGKTSAAPKSNEIELSSQGLTNEEYEEQEQLKRKKKKDLTPEEKARLEELKKKKKQRNDAISILRGISIRMPLLIFGADVPYEDEITLDMFVDKVDAASWTEFMPNGVTKEVFKEFQKYYDEDVFIAAGRRIRNIAREADTLYPTERVKKISALFTNFRNPDKETVLTPWRVVNMHMSECLGGYDFFDENHENLLEEPRFVDQGKVTDETLANTTAKILEINSKTGLYPLYVTYSIFRKRCEIYTEEELTGELQRALWNTTIRNNTFVICKTPMASQITQRTLVGYSDQKVNAKYVDDLIIQMKNEQNQFIYDVLTPTFWDRGGTEPMKFDAIVGNPPYQENISSTSDNSSLSKQLFPLFIQNTIQIKPRYISLITPSRWFTAEAQDKSFIKLREFIKENNHFSKIYNYPNNRLLFDGVEIAGGINYYLYDFSYRGNVNFIERYETTENQSVRPLFEDGLDIIISMNELVEILAKVKNHEGFIPLTTITSGRNAYGIVGKKSELSKIAKTSPFDGAITIRCAHEQMLYTERKNITKNVKDIDRWKVFISKGNGGAGILTDSKPVSILGKAYVGEPLQVCTDSLIPIGSFDNKCEAINLQKYLTSKFLRFIVGILKVSQNVYQNVYQFVPMQDFTSNSDIDWDKAIPEIDRQLYAKYGLSDDEISFIEEKIKPIV